MIAPLNHADRTMRGVAGPSAGVALGHKRLSIWISTPGGTSRYMRVGATRGIQREIYNHS